MQEIRTKGIVIETQDYKEYDKILTILTYDMGVIKAVMKGVKKPNAKSRFAGQMFCLIDVILSKRGVYHTVIASDIIDSYFEIAYKYEQFLLAVDIVKVIKYVSKYNPDSSEMFVLFLSILNVLLRTNTDNNVVYLKFLLSALKILGFDHKFDCCDKCDSILNTVSYLDIRTGGIVCDKCVGNQSHEISEKKIKIINMVNKAEFAQLENIVLGNTISFDILHIVQLMFKICCNS